MVAQRRFTRDLTREMKELFRERDYTRVGYYQSVLESEGIPTLVRNQHLVCMTTEVPIPDMFPALCVVHDDDHEHALDILREYAPPARIPPVEEPVKRVFFIGVLFIFGGLALTNLLPLFPGLLLDSQREWGWIAYRGVIGLGSLWILWITVRRYRAEQSQASPPPGTHSRQSSI